MTFFKRSPHGLDKLGIELWHDHAPDSRFEAFDNFARSNRS